MDFSNGAARKTTWKVADFAEPSVARISRLSKTFFNSLLTVIGGSELLLADDNELTIAASTSATISQSTTPASENVWVSLFQTDSMALLCSHTLNWSISHTG
jgi:hypothetical protein